MLAALGPRRAETREQRRAAIEAERAALGGKPARERPAEAEVAAVEQARRDAKRARNKKRLALKPRRVAR
jgi:hypothetical protein